MTWRIFREPQVARYQLRGPAWFGAKTDQSFSLVEMVEMWHHRARLDGNVRPIQFGQVDDVLIYVTQDVERPVGGVVFGPRQQEREVGIRFAWIDPLHRRCGLFRLLAKAIDAFGQGEGCTEIFSDSLASNAVSRAAHASIGFMDRPDMRMASEFFSDKPKHVVMSRTIVPSGGWRTLSLVHEVEI